MNESQRDPDDLTPAQTESVRRLLADARATDPMPDDVRLRLDDVLRELTHPNVPAPRPPADRTVIDLAARRRSRARNFLIAAAAVVAIGVAVPQVLQGTMSANEDAASSADFDSGSHSGAGGDSGAESQGMLADKEVAPEDAPRAAKPEANNFAPLPRIRDRAFAADAEAARDRVTNTGATSDDSAFRLSCTDGIDLDTVDSTQIPVRYGKQDAVLVLGPVAEGTQRASLYVCGEAAPRRTALLTVR